MDILPPFYIFPNHSLLTTLWRYRPNEIPDKHKNKLTWQSYFFIFRRLENNVTSFFYKQHFYKQQQAEIWSEIIYYKYQNEFNDKYSKWKTCWVKDITATIPPKWSTSPFLQENFDPSPFHDFSKVSTPS